MYEPDIFATTRRFGTILENVDIDPATRELDLDSERFTENTRAAYPLHFIGNADPTGIAGTPRNVVFLTADAFGVLPPISRLTREQAAYHFISGYTAKLAGTEIGVKEPTAHVLGGLRRAVPAAPPRRVRRAADGPAGSLRRPRLAREHRLDRRAVRHRRADEHHPHPEHGPGGAQRRARRTSRPSSTRSSGRGADRRAGRAGRGPPPARHLGRPGRLRRCRGPPIAAMFHENFAPYAEGVSEAVRAAARSPAAAAEAKVSAPGEG